MMRTHSYKVTTSWTGNRGRGTTDYHAYDRLYATVSTGRPAIHGSSDPIFRGDPARWNPELLFVAALSQCHLLWYLHLCAVNGVNVLDYRDAAEGTMVEDGNGGHFEDVVLKPVITVSDQNMAQRATELHAEAASRCFIASSVTCTVRHEPRSVVANSPKESGVTRSPAQGAIHRTTR
jgi:organic hydroperoxide reductase OsmC/OhrA